jgi:biopolymer transport protein ExbD
MTTGAHSTRRTRKVPYKSEGGIKHATPNSEINVTPLVDVCLVLLIIFMVVTPMLKRGKDVKLPLLADAAEHKEGEQVFVSVNDEGAWIDTDLFVDKGDFMVRLEEELKVAAGKAAATDYKGPLLFLKGDGETDWGKVRIVMEWITSSESQISDVALVVDVEDGLGGG